MVTSNPPITPPATPPAELPPLLSLVLAGARSLTSTGLLH